MSSIRQYSTLREWAYFRLREMIVSGVLPPGADIHEGRLCEQLNLSKSPLREALRQLAQEGLVVATSNKGSHVATLSVEDIDEIYSLRYYIEALEVRLAAERITPDQVSELRANIAAMERAIAEGDARGFAERDLEFHRLLAQISGHQRLVRIQNSLQTDLLRLVIQQLVDAGKQAEIDAVPKHRAIVDALERHDPDEAEREMCAHMLRGLELRRQALARGTESDGQPGEVWVRKT